MNIINTLPPTPEHMLNVRVVFQQRLVTLWLVWISCRSGRHIRRALWRRWVEPRVRARGPRHHAPEFLLEWIEWVGVDRGVNNCCTHTHTHTLTLLTTMFSWQQRMGRVRRPRMKPKIIPMMASNINTSQKGNFKMTLVGHKNEHMD